MEIRLKYVHVIVVSASSPKQWRILTEIATHIYNKY
jgi:hypothetical protein